MFGRLQETNNQGEIMIVIHKSSKLILAAMALGLSFSSYSMPRPDRSKLPVPSYLFDAEKDQQIIKEILKLEVYQDDKDSKQFYYVPPFRVRQYAEGATAPYHHVRQLEYYGEINSLLEEKNIYTKNALAEMQKAVEAAKGELDKSRRDLVKALTEGNKELIALLREIVDENKQYHEKALQELTDAKGHIAKGNSLLPEGMRREIDQSIVTKLVRAGFKIEYSESLSPAEMQTKIDEALGEFECGYGGYLALNIYAGFTGEELNALAQYMERTGTDLKISLLPMDSYTFDALTELHNRDKSGGTKMYRNIQGSGDYLGATISLDETISGSFAAAQHLGPHIIPVKIMGQYKHVPPAAVAELACDFSMGWNVYGRSDIKDGAIIYDNDEVTNMHASDRSNHACSLTLKSGDRNSAQFMALEALEKQLESMGMQRIKLSQAEKEAYYNKVMKDIADHRRPAGRYQDLYDAWKKDGPKGAVVYGISRAADFYWHTNAQDVSKISNMKFKKSININGYEKIVRALPTDLCLVYNPNHHAYDRCSPEELEMAKTMQQASKEAQESPECQGVTSPVQCGTNRDEARRNVPVPNRASGNDSALPNSLS
jgi:hypothetical protein